MSQSFAELMNATRTICEGCKVDFEKFQAGLTKLGATEADDLKFVTWEQLQKLGLPEVKARRLAALYRQDGDAGKKAAARDDLESKFLSAKKAAQATDDVLVKHYDPRRHTPVWDELKKRSGDRPFVVFDEQGGLHTKGTLECLQRLIDGHDPVDFYRGGELPLPVYKVGQRPPEVADEHPLHRGEALYKGKDRRGRDWVTGIGLEVKQLLHLAVHDTGELQIRDNRDETQLHKLARSDDALEQVREMCPEATMLLRKQIDEGNAPRLKVQKPGTGDRSRSGRGGNDPFRPGQNRSF
jgi:hypothetical protein